jgi:predicted Zn-dependent protease
VLHEFGHLVGLDHTADPSQVMYSEAQFNVQDYGPGDLRGLAQLGRQACVPEL